MKMSKYFMIGLVILFFILGFNALQDAQPSHKNKRIYPMVQKYSPFYLEKRIGGFSILSKDDDIKEKPPITEVYNRLEQLEKGWGMKHLKINKNTLYIYDNNKTKVSEILFKSADEKKWVKEYYSIK